MGDADADAALVERALQGDRRSIAKVISMVERGGEGARVAIRILHPRTGRAWSIGITGAPGAGKSTLTDQLVGRLRATGSEVGVLAVDPTSPFSGGAVLGDRLRMQAHAADEGVFIRSMATRGHLGGLSRATGDAALVLDAAGKDVVIIETVGVGQDEVDIIRTADVSIVTLVPGTGDEVQALKAGINDKWARYSGDMQRQLSLSVYDGRVLITGTVSNPEWKTEAVRLAWLGKSALNEGRSARKETALVGKRIIYRDEHAC